jgi:hypothetical protein
MTGSDFSRPCVTGFGSSPSRCGPAWREPSRPSARPPRFRRVPFLRDAVFDPGGAATPRIAAQHVLPSASLTASASAISLLSWLNSAPHRIAVYASQPPSPAPAQHSLPGARYGLPGPVFHRLEPASFLAHKRSNNLNQRYRRKDFIISIKKYAVDRFGARAEVKSEIRTWHGDACTSHSPPG